MIRVAVKFLTKVILACVTFLFLPISCTRDSVLPPQTDQPTYFDFKTVTDYHLTVNLNQGVLPTGIIRFDVYTENPFEEKGGVQIFNKELTPVFTGITDDQGKFSDKMRLPTTVKKLYLCVKRLGNPTLLMTTISGETVTFDVKSASKASGTKNQYSAVSLTNAYALASWDALGYPSNVFTTDNVSVGLLFDITTSLPEGEALPLRGTSFLDDTTQTNLVITKNTAIDLVFVHEGAGYKNVLGYYTYPTNNPPSIISVVRKNIAFPNVLFNSSGGGLQTGNRIRLKYWNGTAYQDTFPAGQTLAWFLVANGFSSTTKIVEDGLYINYSDKQFNVESDASLKQHMVLLHDKVRNVMVLSFEETRRDVIGCDQDFNDAIFYAVPSEEDAVQTTGFSSILRGSDYDEDGIIDYEDEYPLDGSLAYSVHYPAHGAWGSLAFEDLWPSQGDYDMNDLVCDYNIVHYLNPQNKVVRADGVIQVRASGANSQNGFG
ncbi:MAG: LruC domain-containing protein, partial [Bacteroidales bacterium]